jgi:peptidoglycan/xylan/chitin deacetylase (PgdA/CDA1 family)
VSSPKSPVPAIPLILCYHKIDPRLELGVTRLSPRRFARQVERLARDGWTALTLDELLACARGLRIAGPREVAITFDDGYRALRDHAFPVLADHGFAATCSLITDHVGRLNRWDVAYGGRRFAHLGWRDAERWRARGIAFVSHTASHRRLTWLDDDAVYRDLSRSRDAMRDFLGEAAEVVSYPFGAAGPREFALAQEAGYEAGFALADRWTGNVMAIPRLPVYPWTTPTPGRGALRGIEWWGAVAANRCSVGTSYWKRWRGAERVPGSGCRVRGLRIHTPEPRTRNPSNEIPRDHRQQ